jgi:hypothetical protein
MYDLFSKRQKKLRGEVPDVYQYEDFPEAFRVQVVHIWRDAFGSRNAYDSRTDEIYRTIHDTLCREYGIFILSKETTRDSHQAGLIDFFLSTKDGERVLDAIEFSFRVMDTFCRKWEFHGTSEPKIDPDAAIEELNARFREHGIGYQYEAMEIIRVDSTIVHSDMIKPTLQLLADPQYLGAHAHYRHGRYKETLNDALKSFESTLKAICKKRGWSYDPTDTAKKLLDVTFSNGLAPPFMQTQFASLRSLLESGIPTVRNKLSGHGQGAQPQAVPQHVAAFGLHLTASAILFVINSEKDLP